MSISHRLGDICTRNFLPISYHWAIILAHSGPPWPWAIFLKIEALHPWVQRKPPMENEVDWLNNFCAMLLIKRSRGICVHPVQTVLATVRRLQ